MQIRPLSKKLLIYQITILLLFTAVCVLGYLYWNTNQNWRLKDTGNEGLGTYTHNAPFYKEIMEIARPLEYSGIHGLTNPNVALKINFAQGKWTLHNVHRYDENGLVLEKNLYGLCGALAYYTYHKIKPILNNKFKMKYAHVSQSGFFIDPHSTHIVLIIYNPITRKAYLLDPSLNRYSAVEDARDYLFFNYSDSLPTFDQQKTDVTFAINTGTPLLIRNDLVTSFSVESSNGKFDKNNFVLIITGNQRYMYSGKHIFALLMKEGQEEIFEDKALEEEAFSPHEIKILKETLTKWFNEIKSTP